MDSAEKIQGDTIDFQCQTFGLLLSASVDVSSLAKGGEKHRGRTLSDAERACCSIVSAIQQVSLSAEILSQYVYWPKMYRTYTKLDTHERYVD